MSPSVTPSPAAPMYGAYYLASLMATAFYSVACVQVFFYYTQYVIRIDSWPIKLFVGSVWYTYIPAKWFRIVTFLMDYDRLADTFHEALTIALSYKQITAGSVNPKVLLIGHPEFFFKYLLTGYISVSVQAFFAYRIYTLAERNLRFIAPLIWFISGMIQIVSCIAYVAKGLYIKNGVLQGVPPTQLGHEPFATLTTTILSTAAVADCFDCLFHDILARPQPELDRVLEVNTGIWTALFAVVSLITLHVFPSSAFNTIISTPICSVYTNTLLASLNARASIRLDMSKRSDVDTYPLSGLQVSAFKRHKDAISLAATQQGIWKTTEMVVCSDVDSPPVKV
ncbi:hypothetical protein JVU11DRAFT_7914 [Chiua virens]|nr:hypothetical protein JVU11DRAFT_7914 [Chiua virens]